MKHNDIKALIFHCATSETEKQNTMEKLNNEIVRINSKIDLTETWKEKHKLIAQAKRITSDLRQLNNVTPRVNEEERKQMEKQKRERKQRLQALYAAIGV